MTRRMRKETEKRVIAKKTHGDKTTETITFRKVNGEKMTLEKEGRTMGQESNNNNNNNIYYL